MTEPHDHPLAVAAFDFDGTLTNGGSVLRFLVAVAGWRAVAGALGRLAPQLVAGAVLGGGHADKGKEKLFVAVLGGREAAEVEKIAAGFGQEHFARHRRRALLRRLEAHQAAGHRVVVVSASPELYVKPVGDKLGVDAVIATRLEVDDEGRLTGRYEGHNCRGQQKIQRLYDWIRELDADQPSQLQLWAYGNSRGDRRMLAAADIGIDASRLGRFGRLRRFIRLSAAPLPR